MSPESQQGPISPEDIIELKTEQIPEEVFGIFNELIAQNMTNGRSRVLQKDVLLLMEQKGISKSEAFNRHWLDVEESYRETGWKVVYDRPVYWGGENFEAYFEFSAGS